MKTGVDKRKYNVILKHIQEEPDKDMDMKKNGRKRIRKYINTKRSTTLAHSKYFLKEKEGQRFLMII